MKVTKSIIDKYHFTILIIIKSMYQKIKKNRYNNLSKKEKDNKAIHVKNWHNNLPEDKKNIKRAYVKNRYRSMRDDKMLELKNIKKSIKKNIEK